MQAGASGGRTLPEKLEEIAAENLLRHLQGELHKAGIVT